MCPETGSGQGQSLSVLRERSVWAGAIWTRPAARGGPSSEKEEEVTALWPAASPVGRPLCAAWRSAGAGGFAACRLTQFPEHQLLWVTGYFLLLKTAGTCSRREAWRLSHCPGPACSCWCQVPQAGLPPRRAEGQGRELEPTCAEALGPTHFLSSSHAALRPPCAPSCPVSDRGRQLEVPGQNGALRPPHAARAKARPGTQVSASSFRAISASHSQPFLKLMRNDKDVCVHTWKRADQTWHDQSQRAPALSQSSSRAGVVLY